MGREVTVLVVDDHDDVRTMLVRILKHSGAQVVAEANSGETAIELMNRHTADVVVMDVQMPGMGGIEATRAIKSVHPSTTVLGFTGWGLTSANEMLDAGASAVFDKTDGPSLMAAITQWMEEHGER